jgi:MFS family permease
VPTATISTSAIKNTEVLSSLKRPALWLTGLGFASIAVAYNAITTQEVSFITDMKVSATVAASALGITLGVGAISSLASGWLADRLASRYVAVLFFLLAIIGMLILIRAGTMSQIWLFVVMFGVGIGALGTIMPIVTRDIFGVANFSTFFGFIAVLFTIGNAIGPPLAGFMFDATGSYHSVFIIITAIIVAAILLIYLAFGANPKPLVRLSKSIK